MGVFENKNAFSTMVQRSLKTSGTKTVKNIFWVGYPGLKPELASPKKIFKRCQKYLVPGTTDKF